MENLAEGVAYPAALRKAIGNSKLLLLLIGPRYLPEYKDENARRLDLRISAMSLASKKPRRRASTSG